MSSPAEEKKELGNKAFAERKYDDAISHYTDAIGIDPSNHVYYSNRSAAHGGNGSWSMAASDAKECIRLNPSFIKGFYRLATAQIELKQYDEALSTISQGLSLDPDNNLLQKQRRQIQALRASARRAATSSAAATATIPAGANRGPADSSASRELLDLQEQFINTNREFNTVKANISKCQREQKMNEITKSELENLSAADADSKMYRGIGKMFMLSSRSEIMENLDKSMMDESKREADLTQKLDYLERRMKSQQQNIQELVGTPSAE